jgi:hypothetical protein
MIDVKQAVKAAYDYMKEVYPEQLHELRLEEVERSEDERYWLITMGYTEEKPQARPRNIGQALDQFGRIPQIQRAYKALKIDAETGDVESMKIRVV